MSDRRDLSRKGKPKTGGRASNTPHNKNNEAFELARKHGPKVIEGLWTIFETSNSEASRISAAKELLDRAYGRPASTVTGDGSGEPIIIRHEVKWLD
jgi:hypothetical protein